MAPLAFAYTAYAMGRPWWRLWFSGRAGGLCLKRINCRCTYSYPSTTTVQKSFWFTKVQDGEPVDLQTDSQYTGRVTYSSTWKDSTLTITNVGNSDSAVYKFRFITNHQGGSYTGDPGVTLSLTDLQVKVGTSRYSFWADLTCVSICTLPPHSSYIWFKNGEKIPRKTSSTYSAYFNNADSYSCALQEHQDFPSPPVCVRGETCNRVKYDVRTICAPKGSSVDIYCTYNGHEAVTSKFWFSPEHSQHWYQSNRVQVSERERGRSTLRISDLRESDSAQHRFKFTTRSFEWRSSLPGTTLTVTALQVQVKRIRAGQHSIEVEMTCHSSCSEVGRLSYVWFRNKQKITRAVTSTYKGWFYLEDEISCALNGHDRFPSPSVYAPKLPSVSVSPSAEIVEGSSVTLTCSSDANPAANYTWFKEDEDSPTASGQIFTINNTSPEHSGIYLCIVQSTRGRHNSTVHLTVLSGNSTFIIHIIKWTLLLLMLISLFLLTLWTRKKKTLNSTTEPNEPAEMIEVDVVYENVSAVTAAQTEDTEEQEHML
ncbi:B-cell receptor CD22-like [Labrus bergylta]|uniref:B-cell receptor CD22-like n=1 Tax=Labrus bergylta TaxID=56723 RepID=UPI00331329D4